MRKLSTFFSFIVVTVLLSSCELSCSFGEKDKPKGNAEVIDGARVYNDIKLETNGVKVEKAYLIFEDGEAVDESNVIDFTQPVHLKISVTEGWASENGKVNLGVSETITTETGEKLLDEPDLFANKYPDGMPESEAKYLTVIAKIIAKQKIPPLTIFNISFNIWDKKNGHSVKGSYKLYSK